MSALERMSPERFTMFGSGGHVQDNHTYELWEWLKVERAYVEELEAERDRLRVCGTCVNYVPAQKGCLLDFMRHGGFDEAYDLSDSCPDWTPYWQESRISR